jgi:hypothetical protein
MRLPSACSTGTDFSYHEADVDARFARAFAADFRADSRAPTVTFCVSNARLARCLPFGCGRRRRAASRAVFFVLRRTSLAAVPLCSRCRRRSTRHELYLQASKGRPQPGTAPHSCAAFPRGAPRAEQLGVGGARLDRGRPSVAGSAAKPNHAGRLGGTGSARVARYSSAMTIQRATAQGCIGVTLTLALPASADPTPGSAEGALQPAPAVIAAAPAAPPAVVHFKADEPLAFSVLTGTLCGTLIVSAGVAPLPASPGVSDRRALSLLQLGGLTFTARF